MRLKLVSILFVPLLLPGQGFVPSTSTPLATASPEPYNDKLFSPGAISGSPAPSAKEKLEIHAYRTVAPRVFVGILFVAGFQQARNSPGAWGHGWDGFGKRYGTDVAVNSIRETIGYGLDELTHEDPRFFRSQKTSTGGRLKDALLQVVVAHTDSDGRNIAYGNIIASYGSAQMAALWLPHRQGTVGDGLFYGTILLAGDAGRNVFREFWPDIRRKIKRR